MATQEDMRIEAIRRLKSFNVMPEVIEKFKNGKLLVSERQSGVFDGILYDADTYEGLVDYIMDYQDRTGYLVYHIQRTMTDFGEMFALLTVSTYDEEWDYELDGEYCFAYVWNKTCPEFSKAGTVGIVGKNGGVSRTF